MIQTLLRYASALRTFTDDENRRQRRRWLSAYSKISHHSIMFRRGVKHAGIYSYSRPHRGIYGACSAIFRLRLVLAKQAHHHDYDPRLFHRAFSVFRQYQTISEVPDKAQIFSGAALPVRQFCAATRNHRLHLPLKFDKKTAADPVRHV